MTDDKPENRRYPQNCVLLYRPAAFFFFITAAIEKDANGIYNIKALNDVINNQAMSS